MWQCGSKRGWKNGTWGKGWGRKGLRKSVSGEYGAGKQKDKGRGARKEGLQRRENLKEEGCKGERI